MKKSILVVMCIFLLFTISGCASDKNPKLIISFDGYDSIEIELYPDKAPNTVNDVITLAAKGYYDEATVFKIVPGQFLEFGDLANVIQGGLNYSIEGEFAANGFDGNDVKFEKGTVIMARETDSYNSATANIIILLSDSPEMEGQYAAIGKVTDGMDSLEKMNNIKNLGENFDFKPFECPQITDVYLKLYGKKYPLPKTIQKVY
ncbi:MAG: peptidylprolyl isomerase [Clostridiales bacterium]|jgi:peptidyl-prolyl cis-trans isomerase B (cyclophilin B)|nr:peptidylprolyl isomerase [Clostridiales bacterium]